MGSAKSGVSTLSISFGRVPSLAPHAFPFGACRATCEASTRTACLPACSLRNCFVLLPRMAASQTGRGDPTCVFLHDKSYGNRTLKRLVLDKDRREVATAMQQAQGQTGLSSRSQSRNRMLDCWFRTEFDAFLRIGCSTRATSLPYGDSELGVLKIISRSLARTSRNGARSAA
jgi:hypothetical protein